MKKRNPEFSELFLPMQKFVYQFCSLLFESTVEKEKHSKLIKLMTTHCFKPRYEEETRSRETRGGTHSDQDMPQSVLFKVSKNPKKNSAPKKN